MCHHTVNKDTILHCQLCDKYLTAGSLGKSSDFCSVYPCLWCKYFHNGQFQATKVTVFGIGKSCGKVSSQESVLASFITTLIMPVTRMEKEEEQGADLGPCINKQRGKYMFPRFSQVSPAISQTSPSRK